LVVFIGESHGYNSVSVYNKSVFLYSVVCRWGVWGDLSVSITFWGDFIWIRGLLWIEGISLFSITLDDLTLFKNINSWLRPLDLRSNVVELSRCVYDSDCCFRLMMVYAVLGKFRLSLKFLDRLGFNIPFSSFFDCWFGLSR